MKVFTLLVACMVLYMTIQSVHGQTSHKGEVCTHKITIYFWHSVYKAQHHNREYYTSCGWFRQCLRTKTTYWKRLVQEKKVRYDTGTGCCPGWSINPNDGNRCTKHSLAPVVVSCPALAQISRVNGQDSISWTGPTFKEPYGKPLSIKTQYPENKGVLKWGINEITYEAISQNNLLSVTCKININVIPLPPTAVISTRVQNEEITVKEGHELKLECKAHYNPYVTEALQWYNGTDRITTGIKYRTMDSDLLGYRHSFATLTLHPSRYDSGDALQCRLDQVQSNFTIYINVTYEVPPVVSRCPYNRVISSADRKTYVTWMAPKFEDKRYGDPVAVTTNYGKGVTEKEFNWGQYKIVYTGTNVRNHLSTSCSFTITVKPIPCQDSDLMPKDGALVCGYWGKHFVKACYQVCKGSHDLMWAGDYSKLATCKPNGQWSSQLSVNCEGEIKRSTCLGLDRCHAGSCRTPGITSDLKAEFISKMIGTEYNAVCGEIDAGVNVNLTLVCV